MDQPKVGGRLNYVPPDLDRLAETQYGDHLHSGNGAERWGMVIMSIPSADWIKDRIGQFSFVEGQVFVITEDLRSPISASSKARAQSVKEYHLTLG